jgi:hypothetical protein
MISGTGGPVGAVAHPVAANAVKAMIRATPILLIAPDMIGTLRQLGPKHPAETRARAIRFPKAGVAGSNPAGAPGYPQFKPCF